MQMKDPILVTGASGFIGRRCVQALTNRGQPVRALVLRGENTAGLFAKDVEIVFGDVTDPVSVRQASEGTGGCSHLAAIVSDAGTDELHQQVTVGGTQHILDAAEETSRVVVVSSITYYGDHLSSRVCHETQTRGRPLGPYSRAKQAQEDITMQALEAGKNAAIVRPGNVYGPASGPWVNDASELLLQGMPALIGGGLGNAGLAYVDNVVDVILAALDHEHARGRAYNACDGLDVTWSRYFSELAALVGARPPGTLPRWVANLGASACEAVWRATGKQSRPPLTHEALNLVGSNHQIPNTRAQEELGVSPRIDYATGMQAVAAYLREKPSA